MFKRYTHILMVGLLLGACSSNGLQADDAASAQKASYVGFLKSYVAQMYERCKDYKELCAMGAALMCAYVMYSVSANKSEAIDFRDFDCVTSIENEKGPETQV